MSHDQRPAKISIVTTGPIAREKPGKKAGKDKEVPADAGQGAEAKPSSGLGLVGWAVFLFGAVLGGVGIAVLLHG